MSQKLIRRAVFRTLFSLVLVSVGLLTVSRSLGQPSAPREEQDAVSIPDAVAPLIQSDRELHRVEGVYTCLLMGTDAGNSRTDTIMLAVFDANRKTASLVSIPRDTLVSVDGTQMKINALWGKGGPELVKNTVSHMLAVPIDYYALVSLDACAAVVDIIGGVWFNVPVDMDYEDPTQNLFIHLDAGYQLLDGQQALGLLRCRNAYSDADLGRVQTQRDFLSALMEQTVSGADLTRLTSLAGILLQYAETDMPLGTMIYFASQAMGMEPESALTSATLPGQWVNPYILLSEEEVLPLINSLGIYQEQLPLSALNIAKK